MAHSQAVDDPDFTSGDGAAPADDLQRFDAFNASTWNLVTPTVPWHRTKRTIVTTVAAGLAAATLVVSGVLLAFRGGSESVDVPLVKSSSTSISIASGTPTIATATAAEAPPPEVPVPPPPPESTPAAPTNVPVIGPPNNRRQPQQAPETRPKRTPVKPRPIVTVKATPAPSP